MAILRQPTSTIQSVPAILSGAFNKPSRKPGNLVPCVWILKPEVRIFIYMTLEFIILVLVSAECTTASLELLKTCLDGITVDHKCAKEIQTVSVINRIS